jgi:hypothetical protein
MLGWLAKYTIKKLAEEWSQSRRDLENQLSPPALLITLDEMIDEIQAAIRRVDESRFSMGEVADLYQAKRRDGTDFNFSYNSVIWGVLYSWSQTHRPECRAYLTDTFTFFVKYASRSKIELLERQLSESQAYKRG